MAGKVRHLINRSGRYHARLVVPEKPKYLRRIIGKTELRAPLSAAIAIKKNRTVSSSFTFDDTCENWGAFASLDRGIFSNTRSICDEVRAIMNMSAIRKPHTEFPG